MKKFLTTLFVALLLLGGGATFYFLNKEYTVKIPRQEIADQLKETQPLTRSYFFVIDVTLENPRLALEEDSDRLRAAMDVRLEVTNGDTLAPLAGVVELSGEIAYRAQQGEFHLAQPAIENLAVAGIPDKYHGKAKDAVTQAMAEYFSNHPLYTLKASERDPLMGRVGLKRVAIEEDGIVATLGL